MFQNYSDLLDKLRSLLDTELRNKLQKRRFDVSLWKLVVVLYVYEKLLALLSLLLRLLIFNITF